MYYPRLLAAILPLIRVPRDLGVPALVVGIRSTCMIERQHTLQLRGFNILPLYVSTYGQYIRRKLPGSPVPIPANMTSFFLGHHTKTIAIRW